MKYRTKLFLLFTALALITNGLVMAVLYWQAHDYLNQQLGSTALSIAASAATVINGDDHDRIRTPADTDSELYKKYEQALRKIRDANRRDDVYVKFIYTHAPDGVRSNGVMTILDAEEAGEDKSLPGELYEPGVSNYVVHFGEYEVQREFTPDKWGTWMTAYAPVKRADGTPAAALGVDFNAEWVIKKLRVLLWSGLSSLGLGVALALMMAMFLSSRVAQPLSALRHALERIGQGDLKTEVRLGGKDEFAEVGEAVNKMVVGLRQREQLKMSFARYVSAEIGQRILDSGQLPQLAGERRKITVLFLDVRGFTTLAEKLNPEQVVSILNELFEQLVEIIFNHQGSINKFLGDGMLALFGALIEDKDQEEHAVRAALDMRKALATLNRKWKAEGKLELRIGIGVNTGVAVVGNIGSEEKIEFTAIGDTVNLGSRVESASKDLGTDIVISEYTVQAIRDKFQFQELQSIQVKGRAAPVTVFTIS